jgi:hypothetical protein
MDFIAGGLVAIGRGFAVGFHEKIRALAGNGKGNGRAGGALGDA